MLFVFATVVASLDMGRAEVETLGPGCEACVDFPLDRRYPTRRVSDASQLLPSLLLKDEHDQSKNSFSGQAGFESLRDVEGWPT